MPRGREMLAMLGVLLAGPALAQTTPQTTPPPPPLAPLPAPGAG